MEWRFATLRLGGLLFVPMLAIFSIWLVARKITRPSFKPMAAAFSLQAGYALWMALGVAMLGRLSAIPDFLVLTIGIVLLMLRPGLSSVIFLTCYHGIAFLVNATTLVSIQTDSAQFKLMIFHLGLRVTAVILMFHALKRIRSQQSFAVNTADTKSAKT